MRYFFRKKVSKYSLIIVKLKYEKAELAQHRI